MIPIIEKIKETNDLKKEYKKLKYLFNEEWLSEYDKNTIEKIIEEDYFRKWIHRGTYISIYDLEKDLGLTFNEEEIDKKNYNEIKELLLTYIELIENLTYPPEFKCASSVLEHGNTSYEKICLIYENIEIILSKLNYKVIEDEELNYIYVVEKDSNIDILLEKEIKPEVKTEILKYISLENKNNLNEKKKILCFLGTEIDNDKNKVNSNDALHKLSKDIGILLNKFNIRHAPHEKTKELMNTESTINEIYDLTFRMIIKFLILYDHYKEDNELYKKLKEFTVKNHIP